MTVAGGRRVAARPGTGARGGQGSGSVPVGPEVLAPRQASREDRARRAQRWARWQAVQTVGLSGEGTAEAPWPWLPGTMTARGHSPVKGQLVALEEVGTVVGAEGGPAPAVTAGCFLHLAVGVQQALLPRPRFGPAAPEGSKEPVAPLAEVGGEEGVQLLPAEEGSGGLGGRRGSGAGAWPEVPRSSGCGALTGRGRRGPGRGPPESPLP